MWDTGRQHQADLSKKKKKVGPQMLFIYIPEQNTFAGYSGNFPQISEQIRNYFDICKQCVDQS